MKLLCKGLLPTSLAGSAGSQLLAGMEGRVLALLRMICRLHALAACYLTLQGAPA